MVIRTPKFNLYLWVLVLALLAGCKTGSNAKPLSTLRIHLEVAPGETSRNAAVPVYRAKPVLVNVDEVPFLTEEDLITAKLVEVPGGFAIQLQFNDHGLLVLDQIANSNPSKHYAVHSDFGSTNKIGRWLAAPTFPRHISNGGLVFTPDASRQESELIIQGLTNMMKKIKSDN